MLFRLRRLLKTSGREIAVLWFACRNPATPMLIKLASVLLGLYFISPIDLIPDTLPLLGWIDDVALIALGIPAILKMVPAAALKDAHFAADQLFSRKLFGQRKI